MGITFVYWISATYTATYSSTPYYWIMLNLLVSRATKIGTAMGITGIGRLCNAIVAMHIESFVLYTVNLSLNYWRVDC